MASITITGLYSNNQKPYSIPVGSDRTTAQAKATEALADKYRFSENAKSQYRSAANSKLVQVLESANGRQPAVSFNMKNISPPQAENKNFNDFKGTQSLIDSRAQSAVRMPTVDMTVGGPNGVGALKESPLLKAPKVETRAQNQTAATETLQNRDRATEQLAPFANRAAAFGRQTALGTTKPGAPNPKPLQIPGSGQNDLKQAFTPIGTNRQTAGTQTVKTAAPKPMGFAPKAAYDAAQGKPAATGSVNAQVQTQTAFRAAAQTTAPVGGKVNLVG